MAPIRGPQLEAILAMASSSLLCNRFANYDKATGLATYATFGSDPDGILTGAATVDGSLYRVNLELLSFMAKTFWVFAFSAVTKGDALVCVADGKVAASSHTVVNSKEVSAPSPGANAKYIVPAAGWGGLHGNAVAVYTHVGTSWAYTEMTTETAGVVVYNTLDGRYYVWSGTAWVLSKVVAYAFDSAVAGSEFVALRTKVASRVSGESLPFMTHGIFHVGVTVSETNSDSTVVVEDDRVLASDVAVVLSFAGANAVYVRSAVCTSKTVTFTLSGAGGAGTIITYALIRAI